MVTVCEGEKRAIGRGAMTVHIFALLVRERHTAWQILREFAGIYFFARPVQMSHVYVILRELTGGCLNTRGREILREKWAHGYPYQICDHLRLWCPRRERWMRSIDGADAAAKCVAVHAALAAMAIGT